jgi:hypothetical protein
MEKPDLSARQAARKGFFHGLLEQRGTLGAPAYISGAVLPNRDLEPISNISELRIRR